MLLHVDFEISALVTTTAGDDDPMWLTASTWWAILYQMWSKQWQWLSWVVPPPSNDHNHQNSSLVFLGDALITFNYWLLWGGQPKQWRVWLHRWIPWSSLKPSLQILAESLCRKSYTADSSKVFVFLPSKTSSLDFWGWTFQVWFCLHDVFCIVFSNKLMIWRFGSSSLAKKMGATGSYRAYLW